MSETTRPLRFAMIREEFVKLTGDFKKAVILNQLVEWTKTMHYYDKIVEEENRILDGEEIEKKHGWIWKKAEELSEETLMGMSDSTIRRHLKDLISGGWIEERNNPKAKWDQTVQYRVNMVKLAADLFDLGYFLQGFKMTEPMKNAIFKMKNRTVDFANAIPENTTENTKELIDTTNASVVDELSTDIEKNTKFKEYQLTLTDKDLLLNELKDRSNDVELKETDKVSYSAPLAHLLKVLLMNAKDRKKYGWVSKHNYDKWVKVLLVYLKVNKKRPDARELEWLEGNLDQFPPETWAHGIRHAKINAYTKLDNNILPYIAETHQHRELKKNEIFAKRNIENKKKQPAKTTGTNFREVEEYEGF